MSGHANIAFLQAVPAKRAARAGIRGTLLAALIAVLGLGVVARPAPAPAQDVDVEDYRPLLDRLDRLERDLNLLQRQVYRGKVQAGGAPGGGTTETAISPNAVADMQVRVSAFESELRSMTGRMEEVRHNLDQLGARLDKLVADVDTRLSAMEQNIANMRRGGTGPIAGAAPGPGQGPSSSTAAMSGEFTPAGGAEDGTLPVQLPSDATAGAALRAPAGTSTEVAAAEGGLLPQGTPLEQYQYARSLLAKADYPAAERTLKAFIQAYPEHDLTENAEYWLGETYYVRSDFTNAAVTYADGYKKYSKGSKAPDNLLKLGLSLANLGETGQACKAFAEIEKKFPDARPDILERAAAEREQRGCQ